MALPPGAMAPPGRIPGPNLQTPGVSQAKNAQYTIVKGDTPASIAAKLGITLQQLLAANPQIEHNGKMVPLTGNMILSNGHLNYPSSVTGSNLPPNTGPTGPPTLEQELAGLPGQERDAYAALKTLFDSYGLGSLAPKILSYLQNGYGSDTITILLQQTDEYKKRFAGNQQRIANGLQVLTPAEYLSTEASYKQLLRQNGLSDHFDNENNFAEWIGKDVSPTELSDRVNLAVQATTQAPPQVTQYFNQLGIGTGDLAAYFLNDQNPTPALQLKLNQAQIGGAALQQNLQISAADALKYAQRGVSYQQTLEQQYLGQSGSAQLAAERLGQQETAAFSGQSGVQKSSFQQQSAGAPGF